MYACIYLYGWPSLVSPFPFFPLRTHTSAHQSTLKKSPVWVKPLLIVCHVCMYASKGITLPRVPFIFFGESFITYNFFCFPQGAHVCAPVDSDQVTRVSQTTFDCLSCMYVCIWRYNPPPCAFYFFWWILHNIHFFCFFSQDAHVCAPVDSDEVRDGGWYLN